MQLIKELSERKVFTTAVIYVPVVWVIVEVLTFLFEKFARRFIDWIKHPVRSIFRALALHLIYTTIVIFLVN